MFCYNNSIDASNLTITQARKIIIIIHYKTNGIMALKKYVNVNHAIITIFLTRKYIIL
jgi:hypothetical protein